MKCVHGIDVDIFNIYIIIFKLKIFELFSIKL